MSFKGTSFLPLLWIPDILHSLFYSSCLINAPWRHVILISLKYSSCNLTVSNNFVVPKVLPLLWKLPKLKPLCLIPTPVQWLSIKQCTHACHAYNLHNKNNGEGSWGQIIRVKQMKNGTELPNALVWFTDNLFNFFKNSWQFLKKKQFLVKNPIKSITEGKQIFIAVSCTLLLSSVS